MNDILITSGNPDFDRLRAETKDWVAERIEVRRRKAIAEFAARMKAATKIVQASKPEQATCPHTTTVTIYEAGTERFDTAIEGGERTDCVDCGKTLGWS